MQFMKGGELFQHLRMSRKFEEKRAKFYTSELILALGHLHSKDIIYRDLKLENILMDDVGNVFLTDFGTNDRFIIRNGQNRQKKWVGYDILRNPRVSFPWSNPRLRMRQNRWLVVTRNPYVH